MSLDSFSSITIILAPLYPDNQPKQGTDEQIATRKEPCVVRTSGLARLSGLLRAVVRNSHDEERVSGWLGHRHTSRSAWHLGRREQLIARRGQVGIGSLFRGQHGVPIAGGDERSPKKDGLPLLSNGSTMLV